jgi:hypothetical protein
LPYQPRRREPFTQRSAGAVKDRPSGHRMLLPAPGALKNPRPHSQLIGQPPGAPGADKAPGPTQLRQRGDARRLIPIAIREREKPRDREPLPPPQDRRRVLASREHIKNLPPSLR